MISRWLPLLLFPLGALADEGPPPAPPIKPLIGVSTALAVPLSPGKPVGMTIGTQVVVPYRSWRFAAEVFGSTPITAFTPGLGGDLGVGLVDGHGVGGALAVYARHTFARDDLASSTQVGPGLLLIYKVAPTVLFTVPLVMWVDVATGDIAPSLAVKAVFGVPYGKAAARTGPEGHRRRGSAGAPVGSGS